MWSIATLPSQAGKTFIVTGGNTGIGYATCLNLVAKGAKVYMGARSLKKAEAAKAQIEGKYPKANIHILILDHNDLSTVVLASKDFMSKEKTLNGLILNAGIMAVPYSLTKDEFEVQMQVNHLAHYVLTQHLLPVLLSTSLAQGPGSARVVCVSSEGHQKSSFGNDRIIYDQDELKSHGDYYRYGHTKLANVLHSVSLNDLYGPESSSAKAGKGEIWVASVHPGFIDSQMNEKNRDSAPWYLSWIHRVLKVLGIIRPWDEGCISSIYVGASEEFNTSMSGNYFSHLAAVKEPNPASKDKVEVEKLELWSRESMMKGGFI